MTQYENSTQTALAWALTGIAYGLSVGFVLGLTLAVYLHRWGIV